MKMVIDFIKNFLNTISSDQAEVGNVIQFLGTIIALLSIIGGIICYFDSKFVAFSKNPKNKAKRLLKEYNHHISAALKNESVFFCEDDPKKLLFYRSVPIKKYHSSKKSHLTKLKLSSYILLGEAGSGKSSIIKKDYLFQCNKFLSFWRIHTGLVYINHQILNQGIVGMSSLEEIVDCVQRTKYKKIYLYIDGIDEFGENKFDEIFERFIPLSKQIKKIKITSRTNFAIQNIINHNNKRFFGFKENQRYIVTRWQEKHLINLASFLLKHLRLDKTRCKQITNKIKLESKNWHNFIDNPLLMKLYLYILAYGDQAKKIDIDNKYLFYTQFVTEVISTQRKRQGNYNVSQIQVELNNISVAVFDAFSKNHKHIQNTKNIAALLKPSINGISHFVHETFFEYFVARNYLLQLSKKHPDNTTVSVLKQPYTNDFADFITYALNSTNEDTRKQIVNTLFAIYYSTLDSNASNKYSSQFQSSCYHIISSTRIRQEIQRLSERQFFTLKYEIVFRMGRIDLCSDEIIDFLYFVYNYDENVNIKENTAYYATVLKRCCAISCSFLGSEQIELDYIMKMLPFNKFGENANYIPDYDLANRSHTLLFYGDITKTNIFDFKDDATNNPYSLAFSKRIERLRFELPENLNFMDKKQKKKYYFRAFDLATIYTFMHNRKRVLSNEEFKIVSNARVQFIGASDERNGLMKEILDLIIDLNDQLKAS